MALLAIGSWGWGTATLALLGAGRLPIARETAIPAPMRVTIGLALFLFAGGIVVAADGATFPFLLGWQLAGVGLAMGALARHLRCRGRGHIQVRVAVPAAAIGLVLGLTALGAALNGPYNANDDGPAYLYLAQRLLSTGGLVDPFNTRRVDSYGGAELFQALVMRMTGTGAGLGVEWFFFALLLVALFATALNRRFFLGGLVLVGLGVVLARPVGAWANVAPTFSGAALSLAALQLLAGARRGRADAWRFVSIGLLLGGLLALRLEFVLPVGVALLGTTLLVVRGRRGLSALTLAIASAIGTASGWAVALWRSSRTIFFPLAPGNLTDASRARNPAIHTTAQYLNRVLRELATDRLGWVLAGSLVVLVFLELGLRRGAPREAEGREKPGFGPFLVFLTFLFGCLAAEVADAFTLSGAALSDVGRYGAPSALAALLFAVLLIAGRADEAWPEGAPRRAQLRGALSLVLGAALFFVALGASPQMYASALGTGLRRGFDLVDAHTPVLDEWASQRANYARLDALVPRGSRIFAAVELPGLLDFSRFSFATLDVPGGASPFPHLPLQGGAPEIVTYLRGFGYEGIVASASNAQGLYDLAAAEANLTSGIYYYRVTARTAVAWDDDLIALRHLYHFQRVGRLFYIPFDEPRASTPSR